VNFGAPELLVIVVGPLTFGLVIWAVIDAAMRPDRIWQAADQRQVVWILVILFLSCVGAPVYLLFIRPKLVAATRAEQAGPPPH